LRKATTSFVMYVCPSAWNNSTPTARIFMKFSIWVLFLCGWTALLWALASSFLRLHDHTHLDTAHSVGLLWTSDQSDAQTSTWQHTNTHNRQTSMPPVGFEPNIPASARPMAHALDRVATGIGWYLSTFRKSVDKIQVSLKSDKNNGYFTWRPTHYYDNMSLNSS
jgi:hypothetical protein